MKLHHPFIISARLLPALKIGEATLSWDGGTFFLDTPDFTYEERNLDMGALGWRSSVVPFETLLCFLSAAAEAMRYEFSDNKDLFPEHVMAWCADNASEIDQAHVGLTNEDGDALHDLIEELIQ